MAIQKDLDRLTHEMTRCVQVYNKVCLSGMWEDSALDGKFPLEASD